MIPINNKLFDADSAVNDYAVRVERRLTSVADMELMYALNQGEVETYCTIWGKSYDL